jgi:hypothetical protein
VKEHIYPRIRAALEEGGDFVCRNSDDWCSVVFVNNRIFSHKIMKIYFTSYDVRLGQDLVHVDTPQSNIMVLNPGSTAHPFRYAKVLGIFHADVCYLGPLKDGRRDLCPRRVDFLWVRWYKVLPRDENHPLALDRVAFHPINSEEAFGFVDPTEVIRAVHLIPQFAEGMLRTDGSLSSAWANDEHPWKYFYINR